MAQATIGRSCHSRRQGKRHMIVETAIGVKLLAPKLVPALLHHVAGTAAVKSVVAAGGAHTGGVAAAKTAASAAIHAVATKAALTGGGKAALAAHHTTALSAAGAWASGHGGSVAVPGGAAGMWLLRKAIRKHLEVDIDVIRAELATRGLEVSRSRGESSPDDVWRRAESEILAQLQQALERHGTSLAAYLSN